MVAYTNIHTTLQAIQAYYSLYGQKWKVHLICKATIHYGVTNGNCINLAKALHLGYIPQTLY